MFQLKKTVTLVLAALLVLTFGVASIAAASPAKAKPRKDVLKKFGLKEDPGVDPDPEKIWVRDGVKFNIVKVPKINTRPSQKGEGWIRYRFMQTRDLEVYQEDAESYWVWLWYQEPYVPEIRHTVDEFGNQVEIRRLPPEAVGLYKEFRKEFTDVTPPPSRTTISFRQSSKGLPSTGSWRNAGDTADMNGDGFVDVILPPERGAATIPSIYLGDGRGTWKRWEAASFPRATQYGSVSVGDLNGDGHLDIAQAEHLGGPVVYLGDGKGYFTEASEGLPTDFASRRLRLGDMDGDGDLDLVVMSEGPGKSGSNFETLVKVKVFLNDGTGSKWTLVDVNEPLLTLGGDWMELADLNDDGFQDIIGSSFYHGGRSLMHVSKAAARWDAVGPEFPINSYYFSVTAGRFTGAKRDEAIMSFQRQWPYAVDPEIIPPPASGRLSGIEKVSLSDDGTITRTPVVQWLGTLRALRAMGAGDFDGDGNLDVAFIDSELLELSVLLGNGKGGFAQATVEGVTLPDNATYDLHVSDLNGDGRPDLLLLFEGSELKKNGSVRVYFNLGSKETDAGGA